MRDDAAPLTGPLLDSLSPSTPHEPLNYVEAQAITEQIRRCLVSAAASWIQAGGLLEEAYERQVWATLGRSCFTEYVELDLSISDSLAYDLRKLHLLSQQFPDCSERLAGIGISKARLLLASLTFHRDTKTFEITGESLGEKLDDAESLTWNDYRQVVRGEDRALKPASVECPHCHAILQVSRAVRVLDFTARRESPPPWESEKS